LGMSASGVWAVSRVSVTPTVTKEASATATRVPTIPAVKTDNITEPGSKETSYRLEGVLEKNRVGKWNGINSVRKVVEMAVDRGVAANTIVLLLMLPLIATLVSGLHYILGLSGYGIFMPTMIGVTLLATGILGGLTLFAFILAISLLSNLLLRRLKLHFWPARSIGLMVISMGTFGLMLGSTYFKILDISKISIFPILFMIMLSEEFVRTQLAKSKSEAKKLMMGTLVLSMVGAVTMSIRAVQEMVLLHPEVSLLLGLILNLAVGSYTGIRLSEIKRFRKAIRKK
jgi:hypothetical protein